LGKQQVYVLFITTSNFELGSTNLHFDRKLLGIWYSW